MLKISIKVTGDKEVMRKLATLKRAGIDHKDAMQDIGEKAIDYFSKDSFATKGRVFGAGWPDYSPAYKVWKEKKYAGRGMLQLTGNMQESFFAISTSNSVTIDNHSPVYKYHQSSAARTKIPRRQMAGINNPIKRIVKEAITSDINRKLRAV